MTISVVPHGKSEQLTNTSSKRGRIGNILQSIKVFKNLVAKCINYFFNAQLPHCKHPVERGIWMIVYIVAIIGMLILIAYLTIDYRTSPTVITTELKEYSIQEVEFPAVAICNNNRFSRKALVELAGEVLELQSATLHQNLTLTELIDMLKHLGNLYYYGETEIDIEVIDVLHTILEIGYNGYDIGRIMKRLTPKCSRMIQACSWGGRDVVCNDIFSLKRTQDGYCCTFNYGRYNVFARDQNEILRWQRVIRAKNVGPEYGLSVLLNPEIQDYAYSVLPAQGFKVLIFSPQNYPMALNGMLREFLISPKTETFLNVQALSLEADPSVIQYDVRQRKCLFHTEKSNTFEGHYSLNECILHCRLKDILRTCDCIPFYYPTTNGSVRICNLNHLLCLREHRAKWANLRPHPDFTLVPFDADGYAGQYIDCDCYPACKDTEYSVSSNSIPLTVPTITWNNRKTFVFENQSILHVNFGGINIVKLKQDVLYSWFELLSNYGGICSLFLGISFVNVLEMFYPLINRFFKSPRVSTTDVKETKTNSKLAISVLPSTTLDSPPLYWNEISGPNKINFRYLTSHKINS